MVFAVCVALDASLVAWLSQNYATANLVFRSPKGKKTGNKAKAGSSTKAPPVKPKGRPKGRTNRNRRGVALSPYLVFVQGMIGPVLALLGPQMKRRYFVFEGAFGHNAALQRVRQTGLEMIGKLQHNAALYEP